MPSKSDQVAIVEILGVGKTVGAADQQLCERFAEGLDLFENRNWPDAAKSFRQLTIDDLDDGPARYY